MPKWMRTFTLGAAKGYMALRELQLWECENVKQTKQKLHVDVKDIIKVLTTRGCQWSKRLSMERHSCSIRQMSLSYPPINLIVGNFIYFSALRYQCFTRQNHSTFMAFYHLRLGACQFSSSEKDSTYLGFRQQTCKKLLSFGRSKMKQFKETLAFPLVWNTAKSPLYVLLSLT